MIKSLLKLMASSASLIALLLATNSAIAAPFSVESSVPLDASSVVSLNVLSSTLHSDAADSNLLKDHWGCSCAVCAGQPSNIMMQI